MKHYMVIDHTEHDWYESELFDNYDDAKKEADMEWYHLTSSMKKSREAFYIAEFENCTAEDFEDGIPDHNVAYDYLEKNNEEE